MEEELKIIFPTKKKMYGKIYSYAIYGIDAKKITVESDIKPGVFRFSIVGLPSSSIKESKDRVIPAIRNSGFDFHNNNYIINLAPADIPKEGVAMDLPIALSILSASNIIKVSTDKLAFAGELSLDGSLRPIKGILPIAIQAKNDGITTLMLPKENINEASIIQELNVYGAENLKQVFSFLENKISLEKGNCLVEEIFANSKNSSLDMF